MQNLRRKTLDSGNPQFTLNANEGHNVLLKSAKSFNEVDFDKETELYLIGTNESGDIILEKSFNDFIAPGTPRSTFVPIDEPSIILQESVTFKIENRSDKEIDYKIGITFNQY